MNKMQHQQYPLLEYNPYTIIRYTLIFLSALLLLASCSTSKSHIVSGDYTKNSSRSSGKPVRHIVKIEKSNVEPVAPAPKTTRKIAAKNSNTKTTKSKRIAPANPKLASSKSRPYDTRSAMVSYAKEFIGIKYVYGGRDINGFDCSGFTCHVMRKFNLPIPPTSTTQFIDGKKISWQKAQIGDLLFFGKGGNVNHVGIVTKNTGHELYVIHSTSSKGVRVDEVKHNSYWAPKIIGAVNYVDQPKSRRAGAFGE